MSISEAAAFLCQTWPCFPCDAQKRPLTTHGYKDATRDPDAARRLFRNAAAIGVPTGAASGLVAIDLDVKDGRPGLEWLAANEHRLPRTRRHKTRSGGLHLIFQAPAGRTIRNSASRIAPGVDVRGDGGYIVVPPSPAYAIADDAMPAPLPGWLLDLLDPPRAAPPVAPRVQINGIGTPYGQAALRNEVDAIRVAPYGAQEETLNRAAFAIGTLVAGGELPEADAWHALAAAANNLPSQPGREPWRPGEAESKARRAFDDGRRNPRQAAPRLTRRVIEEYSPPPGYEEPPPIDEPPPHWGAEPEFEAPEADEAPKSTLEPLWVDSNTPDAEEIPVRPWVVPSYLMRGSVSVLSGQGAGGKSSLVVAWTIALALGQKIGGFEPIRAVRVVNYNTEDDQDEQRRRYAAALRAQQVPSPLIAGQIIRCGPHNVGTLFERDPNTGRIIPTAAMAQLEDLCVETGAEVLICDPLAELHNAEENDNTAMRAVIAAFRGMAQRLRIAILILHHDRKGNNAPGDMDRVRGASAISGAVRVMLTLTSMSTEEAEKFTIPPEHRRRHFRVDGAKSNYAPATDAEWWRLDGYEIPNGETVAAALPWTPPTAFDGVSMDMCVAMLNRIKQGTDGCPFGSGSRARAELFEVLEAEPFNLPKPKAATILAAWICEGLVYEQDGCPSPNSRHTRRGLLVNETKFSEMRRGI